MTWRFHLDEALAAAVRRVAVEEIAKVRATLGSAETDRAPAIHQARRSFKKLRALLRLARPALGSTFDEQNRRFRDAAQLLAHSRDATVRKACFESLVARLRGKLPVGDLERLRDSMNAAGSSGIGGADIEQRVKEVCGLLEAAERGLDRLDWPKDMRQLSDGLRRSQKRLRKSWRQVRGAATPDALHGWRKRLKDQSAQLDLFRDIMPKRLKARHKAAKALAEVLGEDRNLQLLRETLTDGQMPPQTQETRAVLVRAIDRRRKKLGRRAFAQGDSLSGKGAKRLAKQLTAAWEDAAG